MALCQTQKSCSAAVVDCPDVFGCPKNVCPDFEIKRHDTRPPFIVTVNDCDGPLDIEDTIVEVSMWAKAKLKKAITSSDTYFALANNIGFEQSLVGDIIVTDRVRAPEQMLITGHDETNKYIRVQRGYNGTQAYSYKKGTPLKIFRTLNSVGETKTVTEEIEQIDGTKTTETIESQLIYNWSPNDTCLPGCYWLEFKLLKMSSVAEMWLWSAVEPTFASVTDNGCSMGAGVEWVRRFGDFLIKINPSPTSELLS